MRTVLKTNYEDFADIMVGFARDGNHLCCATYVQNTFDLLRALMNHEEVTPMTIEIHSEELDGYDKEYYIELTKDMELFVEPAYREKNEHHEAGYICSWADMIFVDMDADDEIYEYLVPTEQEIRNVEFRMVSNPVVYQIPEEDQCCNCGECRKCDEEVTDFSEEVSLEEVLYKIKEILEDYFD